MSNVPLPPIYENHAGKWIDVEDARAHAAAVSAAKDAEIAGLRAELLKSLADNAALRERVRVLEDALTRLRKWGDMGAGYNASVLLDMRDWIDAGMTGDLPAMPEWAVDREVAAAARKGEA